jgi:5-methylcytosine-specific restriction enzyme subunit McrC
MPNIPIQNLWFLMLYASEYLHQNLTDQFQLEQMDGLEALIGKVFSQHLSDYIHQHLRKQLKAKSKELAVVKGKIDFYQTEIRQSLTKGRVYCSYNETTYNTNRHAYMMSALELILTFDLSTTVRKQLMKDQFELKSYGVIANSKYRLDRDHFSSFEHVCKHVIHLSKLIHDMKLLSTETGDSIQPKLMLTNEKIRKIFEKGIAGFFKLNLDKGKYRFISEQGSKVDLDLENPYGGVYKCFPHMYLDMMIQTKSKDFGLIIDTKFTDMLKNERNGKRQISSEYIRQIYTYTMSYKIADPDSHYAGMLLYPLVDENFEMSVKMLGVPLYFYTVDLSQKIPDIHRQLIKMIDVIFEELKLPKSVPQFVESMA